MQTNPQPIEVQASPCSRSLDGSGRHVWGALTTETVEYANNGQTVAIPRLIRYCMLCAEQEVLG